jgi:uncharacterized protein
VRSVAGLEAGQRPLNGPQTSGRTYRELSTPDHSIVEQLDEAVPMRDGVVLLADVYRPGGGGRHPALVSISPYPRPLQNSGLPFGFVEAGATDFFVPRGYVHVLANSRGSCGSGGTYSFFDEQEREDLHDLIVWVAEQAWCDGQVGMVGISYFAIAQLHAAAAKPEPLVAIFPLSGITDLYREASWHGGMLNNQFLSAWLTSLGVLGGRSGSAFRAPLAQAAWRLLRSPRVHRRMEHVNGEAAFAILGKVMRARYDPHPWDDLFFTVLEHEWFDSFWRERDMSQRLGDVSVPAYFGSDWDNVTLELSAAFSGYEAMPAAAPKRIGIMGSGGLTWPWESFHVEALAWFDHWLKQRDTGIDEGPPIRYVLQGTGEWRASETWPPEGVNYVELALAADGELGGAATGEREYLFLPPALVRMPNANPPTLPSLLSWETPPAPVAYDLIGHAALELDAVTSGNDVDWIVKLQLIRADGSPKDLTQGWLRASHRALGPASTRPGRPRHPHETPEPVQPGAQTSYAIGLVPTAQRVEAGQRLRLLLTSCDHQAGFAMVNMTHLPLGRPSRQTILASSRLQLPAIGEPRA